jgi:hypothetical protein
MYGNKLNIDDLGFVISPNYDCLWTLLAERVAWVKRTRKCMTAFDHQSYTFGKHLSIDFNKIIKCLSLFL